MTPALLAASAEGSTKAAFTVQGPSTIVNEQGWTVTVSGFSGPYNHVMVANEKGAVACPTLAKTYDKQTKPVPKGHKFKVSFHSLIITGKPPQSYMRCVYLFSGSKYIVKGSRYEIVPTAAEKAEMSSEG